MKRKKLRTALFSAAALLTAYILTVAFVKVDFVWPIIIACGLAPALVAIGVLLCYGSGKARRALCGVVAAILLCVSALGAFGSAAFNDRKTVCVSVSPKGARRMVAVQIYHGNLLYPICPAWGLWYRQRGPLRAYHQLPAPNDFRWLDEDTVEIHLVHEAWGGCVYQYDFSAGAFERAG